VLAVPRADRTVGRGAGRARQGSGKPGLNPVAVIPGRRAAAVGWANARGTSSANGTAWRAFAHAHVTPGRLCPWCYRRLAMSRYRRAKVEGGVFFFTVTLPNAQAICWSVMSTACGRATGSYNNDTHSRRSRSASFRTICMLCGRYRKVIPIPAALEPHQERLFPRANRRCAA
jgi:hypothetical protein